MAKRRVVVTGMGAEVKSDRAGFKSCTEGPQR